MRTAGYYEISRWNGRPLGLKVMAMPGNLILNRRHWQNGIEVLVAVYGELTVEVEDRVFHLDEGDFITVDAGLSHEIRSGKVGSLQMVFNIDNRMYRRESGTQVWLSTVGDSSIAADCPDAVELRNCITKLVDICYKYATTRDGQGIPNEDWYGARLELDKVLMIFSKHAVSEPVIPVTRSLHPDFIRLIESIHRDYAEDISATNLAMRLGYGESSIYRLFKRYTGESLNDYIQSVRINNACGMLLEAEGGVMEIAYACGFTSSSSFYRIFKKKTGMTPVEYRELGLPVVGGNDYEQEELLRHNVFQPISDLSYSWSEVCRYI